MKTWQLQTAKNKLSELLDLVQTEGPQVITRHGKETAVVVSFAEFLEMESLRDPLGAFLSASPLCRSGLDLSRSEDSGRDVDL